MATGDPEKLIQEWKDYKVMLNLEIDRAIKILRILEDLPAGVTMPGPPQIDFDVLTQNIAAKSPPNGNDLASKKFKWNEKFKEIMEEETPNPLYSNRRMTKVISERWPEIINDSQNKNRVSNALTRFYDLGKCGRVEFAGPRYEYGHLRYFSNPTTLKAKYAHLGENSEPQEDARTTFSSLPELFTPSNPTEKRLTSQELKDWSWQKEIKKFLEEYDPSINGLPTAVQVAVQIGELNKPLKIDSGVISSVNSHLGQIWRKGEIGRVNAEGSKKFVYGALKYFTNTSTLKKEFDYLRLNFEDNQPK
jgi:hypothetical protein